jgi:S-adenosylmethionine hydrolase
MIVLLTDFGQSEYVGIMKGVMLGISPSATLVDLCHDVRPQNLIEASWLLKAGYKFFPPGAVFCCVVDPGVGTSRKAVAVRTLDYSFVAPDNGLLWEALAEQPIVEIREIPIPEDASPTFHGRDVFAKAAGMIDMGQFGRLGSVLKGIEKLTLHRAGREGIVVRIDHFGNIITNLPPLPQDRYMVNIGDLEGTMAHCPTYAKAPDSELFLITGSADTLEISLREGSARDLLSATPGQIVTIQ